MDPRSQDRSRIPMTKRCGRVEPPFDLSDIQGLIASTAEETQIL